jgi:hypothetical protein
MEGSRHCAQCDAVFEPRREHARFCSAACRVAWSREHTSGGPWPGDTALGWSAAAMGDAARRLGEGRGLDLPQALAVISEAVWWVTMVDATMVRYYPDAYDRVLAGLDPAGRRKAEGTLGGLRFVRNWMGYRADPADFVRAGQAAGGGDLPVAEWTWVPVPAPAASPAPKGREWEMSRYRKYRARLAGQPVGRTVGAAVAFLSRLPAVGDQAGKNSLPP